MKRNGDLKIGEAAKRLGMRPRTIRFYESAGLLPPPQRTAHGYASAGHRLFGPEDLRRLQFVRQARLLDLSLDQIRELVEVTTEGCCGAARPHLKALIQEKLPELRRRIAELRRLEAHLEVLQQALPDDSSPADPLCDGTVHQCVPLTDQPLLQIRPSAARTSRSRASRRKKGRGERRKRRGGLSRDLQGSEGIEGSIHRRP